MKKALLSRAFLLKPPLKAVGFRTVKAGGELLRADLLPFLLRFIL